MALQNGCKSEDFIFIKKSQGKFILQSIHNYSIRVSMEHQKDKWLIVERFGHTLTFVNDIYKSSKSTISIVSYLNFCKNFWKVQ